MNILIGVIMGFVVSIATVATVTSAGQPEGKKGSTTTGVPSFFQVYSPDGRQSVKAQCSTVTTNKVNCNLILVEFLPPKRADQVDVSLEAAAKADPKLAEQLRKNPNQVKEDWTRQMENARKDFCSASSKEKIAIETKIRDPQIGPKRKKDFQNMLQACTAKDPQVFVESVTASEKRTCRLMVNSFRVDFERIGAEQWLSNPGPQGLCNVVTTYSLRQESGYSILWTLSETMIAADTKGPLCKDALHDDELNKPIVWSWKNYTSYELPPSCDFIEPAFIIPQFP